MTDTSSRAGGRQPTNLIAGSEYAPIVGADGSHTTGIPPGLALVQSSSADHTVIPGRANAAATSSVLGLATRTSVVGDRATLQSHGVLTLTETEWDAVTGGSGGLTRNTLYYLSEGSPTGHLTDTPPTTPGQFITQVGLALSPIDLLIQIGPAAVVPGG